MDPGTHWGWTAAGEHRPSRMRHARVSPLAAFRAFWPLVRANIFYGRPDAADSEVLAAAVAADVHGFVSALPEGYDTPVGRHGNNLSGGQRRRVALAQAMLRNAPVLVLDEPATGLDDAATARIMTPLRHLTAGRTTFLMTHDRRPAALSDLVLHLSDATAVLTTPEPIADEAA